jgi:D-alanyl-D-alanine carboxypeptidase
MRITMLVVAALPVLLHAQPARQATLRAADQARITKSLDSLAKSVLATGVPGMTLLVARGDRPVYFKSFGLANLDLDAPATNRTVYHTGSITKQFTAAAILRLVQENKVSLDASVTSYLPELPRHLTPITVRHLLTHTSGLAPVGDFLPGRNASRLEYPRGELYESLVSALSSRPAPPAAGARYEYSGVNYLLLGLIVERSRGRTLWQELRERFFEPLGMRATALCDPAVIMKGRAVGYVVTDTGTRRIAPAAFADPSTVLGNAGLCSNAEDLLKWQRAIVGRRVLNDSMTRLMLRPAVLNSGLQADYGFGIVTWKQGQSQVHFHTGAGWGFTGFLGYVPASDATMVILVNSNSDILQIGHDVLGIERGRRAQAVLPTLPTDLASLLGTYEGSGFRSTVTNDAGKLRLDSNGIPSVRFAFTPALRKTGDRQFALPWDPDSRVTFLGSPSRADSLRIVWEGREVVLRRVQ